MRLLSKLFIKTKAKAGDIADLEQVIELYHDTQKLVIKMQYEIEALHTKIAVVEEKLKSHGW